MRLVPDSRRGTWLLAGAVWLTACTGLWWALPVVPRVRFELPDMLRYFRFSPDGTQLLTFDLRPFDEHRIWFGSQHIPNSDAGCRIWNLRTGKKTFEWHASEDTYTVSWSGDCALIRGANGDDAVVLRNLRTGDSQGLPWPALGLESAANVTPDGRFLVVVTRRDGKPTTYWWDLHTRTTAGVFPNLEPVALASDGRWLTGTGNSAILCVRAQASGAILARLNLESSFTNAEFTSDGRYVILSGRHQSCNDSVDVSTVFDTQNGRRCGVFENRAVMISSDSDQIFALDRSTFRHEKYNLTTGELESSQPVVIPKPPGYQIDVWPTSSGETFVVVASCISTLGRFPYNVPVLDQFAPDPSTEFSLVTARSGEVSGAMILAPRSTEDIHVAPGGQSILTVDTNAVVSVWDNPPRKSLTWFVIGAAVLAMVIASVALRRMSAIRARSVRDRSARLTPGAHAPGSTGL